MTLPRRVAPAMALAIIAPVIAEFLLGDFNIRQIGFVIVFISIYGTGALLIRELTRQTRRGWPTMRMLAVACGASRTGSGRFAGPRRDRGRTLRDVGGPRRMGTDPRARGVARRDPDVWLWISLRRLVVAGGTSLGVPTTAIDVVGQAALLLVMLALGVLALRQLRRPLRTQE